MAGSTVVLSEVFVSADDPMEIVKAAMNRIEQNYSEEAELVRCFYRETARKGSRFISVAEAVTEMYKSPYIYGPERDAVAILKGRRIMKGKMAADGIADFRYATIIMETSDNSHGLIEQYPNGSYFIYKDGDGKAEDFDW